MTEYLTSPIATEYFPEENFQVFENMTSEQFKCIVLGYVDYKVVRVSPELIEKLNKYNNKNSRHKARQDFDVQLSKFKKKEAYKNLSNEDIRDLESQKIIEELQKHAEKIHDMIIVQSTKNEKRILGVAYAIKIDGKRKVRYYIRYSTLIEKTEKAQKVIDVMTTRVSQLLKSK